MEHHHNSHMVATSTSLSFFSCFISLMKNIIGIVQVTIVVLLNSNVKFQLLGVILDAMQDIGARNWDNFGFTLVDIHIFLFLSPLPSTNHGQFPLLKLQLLLRTKLSCFWVVCKDTSTWIKGRGQGDMGEFHVIQGFGLIWLAYGSVSMLVKNCSWVSQSNIHNFGVNSQPSCISHSIILAFLCYYLFVYYFVI